MWRGLKVVCCKCSPVTDVVHFLLRQVFCVEGKGQIRRDAILAKPWKTVSSIVKPWYTQKEPFKTAYGSFRATFELQFEKLYWRSDIETNFCMMKKVSLWTFFKNTNWKYEEGGVEKANNSNELWLLRSAT